MLLSPPEPNSTKHVYFLAFSLYKTTFLPNHPTQLTPSTWNPNTPLTESFVKSQKEKIHIPNPFPPLRNPCIKLQTPNFRSCLRIIGNLLLATTRRQPQLSLSLQISNFESLLPQNSKKNCASWGCLSNLAIHYSTIVIFEKILVLNTLKLWDSL